MRWKMLAAVALLVLGGGAVVWAVTGGPGSSSASDTGYLTAAASQGDVTDTAVATGALERGTQYALAFGAAPVTGSSAAGSGSWPVTEVKVPVGAAVKKGDVLAAADSTGVRRDLRVALADLEASRLQRKAADGQLDDASGTAAKRQARIAVQQAISQQVNAEGKVADLREQLSWATLTAPEDGVVMAVNVSPGADAPSGAAIVIATGPLHATADFAEGDLADLKVGQKATVEIEALGSTVDGTVSDIATVASTEAGGSSVVTYAVTVDLSDAPADARSGMTAQVTVITDQATGVVFVPTSALQGTSGAYRVLVMGADGIAQQRDVTVGLVTAAAAEIKSGLEEGETVVTGTTASQIQNAGSGFPGAGGGGAIPVSGGGTRDFTPGTRP